MSYGYRIEIQLFRQKSTKRYYYEWYFCRRVLLWLCFNDSERFFCCNQISTLFPLEKFDSKTALHRCVLNSRSHCRIHTTSLSKTQRKLVRIFGLVLFIIAVNAVLYPFIRSNAFLKRTKKKKTENIRSARTRRGKNK